MKDPLEELMAREEQREFQEHNEMLESMGIPKATLEEFRDLVRTPLTEVDIDAIYANLRTPGLKLNSRK